MGSIQESIVTGSLTRRAAALLVVALAVAALAVAAPTAAAPWGFSAEVGGVVTGAGGNPFVFRLTPAKMLSDEFSLGGSFYFTPAGDAQMHSGSFLAQYRIRLQNAGLTPFFGIGVCHRRSVDDSDTAFMFPIGTSLEVPVGKELSFMGTLSLNIHDIELDGEQDSVSGGLTFGIDYAP
jgi:hypothetical protein